MGTGRGGQGLNIWNLLGLGGYDAVCLLVGMGLGWFADSRLHTTPIFVLVGLALGLVLAVVGTWLEIRKFL